MTGHLGRELQDEGGPPRGTAPSAAALPTRLARALAARRTLLDPAHEGAWRLFAGFYEGVPELVVDVYATTLLVQNYADPPEQGQEMVQTAVAYYDAALPWLGAVVVKPRHAADPLARRGTLRSGAAPTREIREAGIRYRVDLLAGRDAGLYLDTRLLRAWLRAEMAGRTVLNTFAYTGSLGVAAMAGGAGRVVHLDASRSALNVAKTSYTLNGLPIRKADFLTADFWAATSRLRRAGATYDCVVLDPPFFATSAAGTVDLERAMGRLVNKVRPLVADGGYLVVVNNALYVPGSVFLGELERLGEDGYLAVEALVEVPEDVAGPTAARVGQAPADPAPFNHPTKIALLRVRRKGGGKGR